MLPKILNVNALAAFPRPATCVADNTAPRWYTNYNPSRVQLH